MICFYFQSLIPAVQMVLLVWLVARPILRELWRSVIVESGALSVITAGTAMMQQWSVSSGDSRQQVGCNVVAISNSDTSWKWLHKCWWCCVYTCYLASYLTVISIQMHCWWVGLGLGLGLENKRRTKALLTILRQEKVAYFLTVCIAKQHERHWSAKSSAQQCMW